MDIFTMGRTQTPFCPFYTTRILLANNSVCDCAGTGELLSSERLHVCPGGVLAVLRVWQLRGALCVPEHT